MEFCIDEARAIMAFQLRRSAGDRIHPDVTDFTARNLSRASGSALASVRLYLTGPSEPCSASCPATGAASPNCGEIVGEHLESAAAQLDGVHRGAGAWASVQTGH